MTAPDAGKSNASGGTFGLARLARSTPARLLAEDPFRRVWLIGGLVGTVRWLEILSISVFTYDLTNSPLWVAAMMVARMLPMVLFGTIVGAYAERFNRYTLMLGGLWVMFASSITLASLALAGTIALWQIAAAAFLSGTYFASEFPVRRTILSDLATKDRVGTAMALDSATNNATRMLGPAIGGVLFQTTGLPGAYLVGSAFYAISILLLFSVRYRSGGSQAGPHPSIGSEILAGLRYARSNRPIVGTLLVTVFINLFAFPFATMIPVIGREALGLSPALVGFLASAEGTGAFLGALIVAGFARPRHYGRIYIVGAFMFLCAILVFSFTPHFGLAWAVLVTGGLGVAGFASMQSTILLVSAAPEFRSRVMGLLAVSIGAGPFGVFHVGFLAEHLGGTTAVTVIALEGLAVMTATFLFWRTLWRQR